MVVHSAISSLVRMRYDNVGARYHIHPLVDLLSCACDGSRRRRATRLAVRYQQLPATHGQYLSFLRF